MTSHGIGRRELLMGAGAGTVALATLGLSAAPAAAERRSAEEGGLEGAWLVTHTDSQGSAQAVATFGTGGDLASRDINPPGPPQMGAWAAREDNHFVATFYSGESQGPNSPSIIVKVILHGSWEDDELSGTDTFEVRDGSGKVLASGSGTFSGTRIEAGE